MLDIYQNHQSFVGHFPEITKIRGTFSRTLEDCWTFTKNPKRFLGPLPELQKIYRTFTELKKFFSTFARTIKDL